MSARYTFIVDAGEQVRIPHRNLTGTLLNWNVAAGRAVLGQVEYEDGNGTRRREWFAMAQMEAASGA